MVAHRALDTMGTVASSKRKLATPEMQSIFYFIIILLTKLNKFDNSSIGYIFC